MGSDWEFSVYDPDESPPRLGAEAPGPALSLDAARQRNLARLGPGIRAIVQGLAPVSSHDGSPASYAALVADLEKLFTLPVQSLSQHASLRAYLVYRDEITPRAQILLDELQSDTADVWMKEIRRTPDAGRACVMAALTWAAGLDPFIARTDEVFERLLTLCRENRRLADRIDACLQRLECRDAGRRLVPGLRTMLSRRGDTSRLPYAWKAMLRALDLSDFRPAPTDGERAWNSR